jgi:CRP/FNR family transcriptional regulator
VNKPEVLQQFQFFRQSSASLQTTLQQGAHYACLPEGAYFFHEGDRCDQVALVGAGNIRVYKTGETGREITLYHVRPGEGCLLNMLSVFRRVKTAGTALVETAVEAVVFPADTFRELVARSEAVRSFVFEMMAARLVHVLTLVEEITFRKMDMRLADFLLHRFAAAPAGDSIVSLTHEQIAAELGTAREVVSRLLKELERVGAIELARGQVKLCDKALLNKLRITQ